MSQSPTDAKQLTSLNRYRQGWKALNRLLHEDRSFSGQEKNCAFLNMQNGQFGSISSVSGLDFVDDARALAVCDWDFDGKLDLWSTARTAPRIRFVHNRTDTKRHFLALQLCGNGRTTNRDAIGARVELVTNDERNKSIATVHAGDGFLTQSSRWLHFGLGDAGSAVSVRVKWPGGTIKVYPEIQVDRFHVIDQASGRVRQWDPPTRRVPLEPTPDREVSSTQVVRIIPPYRLPIPKIEFEQNSGAGGTLSVTKPTLVTVWSASCVNCISELTAWSKQQALFASHDLDVIALNADFDRPIEGASTPSVILAEMSFPFRAYRGTEKTIRALDHFQRAIMDRWEPLPVPTSFLLDRFGQVVAVYKGPIELAQLWSDMDLIDATPDQIRMAGLPFGGRWAAGIVQADPTRVSSQMVDHRSVNGAIDYLQRFIDTAEKASHEINPTQLADVQYVRSVLLETQGRNEEALKSLEFCRSQNPNDFRVRTDLATKYLSAKDFAAAKEELAAALAINPAAPKLRRDLGVCLLQLKEYRKAVEQFVAHLREHPHDATTHHYLGNAWRRIGNWPAAIESYENAVANNPSHLLAANNLAWIVATHPEPRLRDAKRAVRLAERMCQQTKFSIPELLDTLAAAYAESGQYDKAVQVVDRAIRLAKKNKTAASNDPSLAERRKLYLQKQPYRDRIEPNPSAP